MSEASVDPGQAARRGPAEGPFRGGVERELGVKDDGRAGPLVLITAGLHGNEPAGVVAARRVLAEISGGTTAGRVVALAGNRGALMRGERHGGQDLNRLWRAPILADLMAQDPADDRVDEAELRELLGVIERERGAAHGAGREVILLDLHSTSAAGGPFSVVPDVVRSRRLARAIGLPVVLGLEQRIEGPLLTWIVGQGEVGVVLEGGQHEDPQTVEVLVDALHVALQHAGVTGGDLARAREARGRIDVIRGDVPPVLDMVYAHPIEPEDGFVMEPGWSNFRPVCTGQGLGLQRGEVVQAPIDAFMLMPLYQGLGSEGFFLCERVSRSWLTASRVVRWLRLDWMLWLLPGVRAVRSTGRGVLCSAPASRRTESWLALFGYRTSTRTGDEIMWTRRRAR
ncbi:MAG: succinylglutamate desuccinylase/aspartoacylase family protein [Planctomycetota bacterium]|nr:succinylglutamate desuccinylase/aspartoacylase family protein [Planctomycetota bacterium]MDG1985202.1 succinylglutamate desuccinylase/aspartoacylase family protein [Planctomycetota bacterium]